MARSFKSTMALPPPDPQYILRGANDAVNTLCFHCRDPEPEFPMLFSGSANGLIHIWNLKTRRVDRTLDGHGGKSVYWVKTFPNRREAILSQGRDQHVCLWDLAEGRNSVTDSLCTGNVGFCKGSLLEVAEGRWLLATAWKNLEEPSSGSSPLLLVGYEDGSVVLWNLSTGSTLSRLACHQEPIMGLDFDAEKAKGVSGSSEKILCVWSLDEQQNLELQQTHQLTNPGIAETALRPDKKILATAGWDHRIRLFGWKKLKPLAVLDYHTAAIHCVAFSDHAQPSERLLAAGSKDHRISLWSIYSQA
ncbi:guanine nucleotide-binding protein subunit beta-like protein 1 isoform X4 [Varanus komodoensis]|uniref:guanine nucleotide-binding protein subunit beta-like protein 1 isoform X4 n=1 Tax=Varanus komodoensis TaxID=61221 RepID=UPI001CF7B4A7|nr:guanine nucleotide-binding protein subunit beta-like protein 1 isoform X4 [Varanus komodoensis]